ncbi:hypothetical protein K474DRAFT_1668058 [Panus rudis PR-1116 ss-1]|nr:hypothetical protein K474DRAFT_1668058 [Panus rudis PR-1116 ss-1]
MVHRPADSRLLVNLLSHEKDYLKQLLHLLDQSQTSLASFSAYAAASPPPASQVIISVAGAFAGADEALRKYAGAVEQWQVQLRMLKEMEDEVANVMRDREILVTRLIKASKSSNQKSARESILATAGSSSSTLSFSNMKFEVPIGSKLATAQTELQACEAHLAIKERELEEMRTRTIRIGLQVRCRAMVECGWAWGEMGKEGLRALDMIDIPMPNGHGLPSHSRPTSEYQPPRSLDHGSSDHSSVTPSQSASQTAHFDLPFLPSSRPGSPKPQPPLPLPPIPSSSKPYTLNIPPAHSISELTLPNGYRHQIAREEEEEGAGSSAEEGDDMQDGAVQVHENTRFSKRGSSVINLPKKRNEAANGHGRAVSESLPNRRVKFQPSGSDSHLVRNGTGKGKDKERDIPVVYKKEPQRRGSVLGGIAAFFHVRGRHVTGDDADDGGSVSSKPWHTRTNKNLSKAKKGDDSSDDELPASASAPASTYPNYSSSLTASTSAPVIPDLNTGRLRKKSSAKRSSVQAVPLSSSRNRLSDVMEDVNAEKGWASDGAEPPPTSPPLPHSSHKKKGKKKARELSVDDVSGSGDSPNQKGKLPNGSGILTSSLPTEASISRNPSLSKHSTASTPATTSAAGETTIHPATPTRRNSASQHSSPPQWNGTAGSSRRRTASLDVGALKTQMPTKVLSGTGYPDLPRTSTTSTSTTPPTKKRRSASTSHAHNTDPGQSLMSIIEGVRQSRDGWAKMQDRVSPDPNRLLVSVKAPGSVVEKLGLFDEVTGDVKLNATQTQSKGGEKEIEPTPLVWQPRPNSPPPIASGSQSLSRSSTSQSKRAAQTPLRSALRHAGTSRSPSPGAASNSSSGTAGPVPSRSYVTTGASLSAPVAGPSKLRERLVVDTNPAPTNSPRAAPAEEETKRVPSPPPTPTQAHPLPAQASSSLMPKPDEEDGDDAASISSYVTVHESFAEGDEDGEEEGNNGNSTPRAETPPPIFPVVAPAIAPESQIGPSSTPGQGKREPSPAKSSTSTSTFVPDEVPSSSSAIPPPAHRDSPSPPSATPVPAKSEAPAPVASPSRSPSPPPPPVEKEQPNTTSHSVSSDGSASGSGSGSHSRPPNLTIRKSVRMALPPTFSTTPPALDDYDNGDGDGEGEGRRGRAPWSSPSPQKHVSTPTANGPHYHSSNDSQVWRSKIADETRVKDVWVDSSDDEDDDGGYNHAKRLLSKLSRKL